VKDGSNFKTPLINGGHYNCILKERRLNFSTEGTFRPVLEAAPYHSWWMPKHIVSASTIAFINESNGGPYWIRLEPVSSRT